MEQAVKQRLVGAMVLAAIAVVTLPIIFDAERPPSVQVPEVIPPAPAYPPVAVQNPNPVALPPDRPTEEPTPVADMYAMSQGTGVEAAVEPVPEQKPSTAVAAAVPNGKSVPPVPPAAGGKLNKNGTPEAWVVQVAAMSDQKKIDALVAGLKLRGHTVFTRTTPDGKGNKTTRVYIGPKLDKAQALKIKQQIDIEQKLQTIVKPFTP
ncbi:MAG TPA: SPOR domain-containing protein [Pseudomonadales bacterium]|nr:SPOR domain-containing protein [Pseudomonadales bacterium]